METLTLVMALLGAVLVSSVLEQLVPNVSLPLMQIAMGLVIALFAAEQIRVDFNPEVFLVLFIAPLLFDEAKHTDRALLLRDIKPVLALAIGLVVATMLVVGFCVHLIIPSIPLAAAFALGAALGPTDAVAVSSLSSAVDIPARQGSILKGEMLLNDASGLVSFQFAVAAAITGTFSLLDATVELAVEFVGGLIAGAIMGWLLRAVNRWTRSIGLESITFHVLYEVVTPFVIYLLADTLGVSGVISVVVAGLMGIITPREAGPSVARMNIVSSSVWKVLSFTLNGIVFVLLGTQLPLAMETTWEDIRFDDGMLIGCVFVITVVLLALRFLWCFGLDYVHWRKQNPQTRPLLKSLPRLSLVTTLAGAKGAMTLCIMFTLSYSIVQRNLLIFLACGVIVLTLLVSTYVLPFVSPKQEAELSAERRNEVAVHIEILRNVIEQLTAKQTKANRRAVRTVIRQYNARIANIKDKNNIDEEEDNSLRLEVIDWESDYVNKLLRAKEVPSKVAYRYLARSDRARRLLKHGLAPGNVGGFLLRLRSNVRALYYAALSLLPNYDSAAEVSEYNALHLRVAEYVVSRLSELVLSDSAVPTEQASQLFVEYQRVCAQLRGSATDMQAFTNTEKYLDDVRKLGVSIELAQIQSMLDDKRLSKASARRLRESALVMQMDLENYV